MKNSTNYFVNKNSNFFISAIAEATSKKDFAKVYDLENEAKNILGENWRFMYNLEKDYHKSLESAKNIAERLHDIQLDLLFSKIESCENETQWLDFVSKNKEIENQAIECLNQEFKNIDIEVAFQLLENRVERWVNPSQLIETKQIA